MFVANKLLRFLADWLVVVSALAVRILLTHETILTLILILISKY